MLRPQLHFPFAGEAGQPRPRYDTRLCDLTLALSRIVDRKTDAEALHLARRLSPSYIAGTLCGAKSAMTLDADEVTCRRCLAELFNAQKAEVSHGPLATPSESRPAAPMLPR